MIKEDLGSMSQSANSSAFRKSPELRAFLDTVKNIGHPKYPILDHQYSPNSRIPCTDLVPFISKRLASNDINSIKELMKLVIDSNPGLGVSPSWISESIDEILSIPFEKYVSFPSTAGLLEMKAMYIVAAKNGGNRTSLITEEIPRLISWACAAHQPQWSDNLYSLEKIANAWISDMAKDIPYWQNYKKFNTHITQNLSLRPKLRERIIELTPAARLQLFYAIQRGGGPLKNLTDYSIRSFGINVNNTSEELARSDLIVYSFSPKMLETVYNKQELFKLCHSHNVPFKKSWKKNKIIKSLIGNNSKLPITLTKYKKLITPNFNKYPELKNIVHTADQNIVNYMLLCFL